MPIDKPEALQLGGTLSGTLGGFIGQVVSVYLLHVRAPVAMGTPVPGQCPPQPAPGQPCPPRPAPGVPCPPYPSAPVTGGPAVAGPGGGTVTGGTPIIPGSPCPSGNVGPIPLRPADGCPAALSWVCEPGYARMMTTVVTGTLAFAGVDYLVIRVRVDSACRDVVIPYNAVGAVVPMGPAM